MHRVYSAQRGIETMVSDHCGQTGFRLRQLNSHSASGRFKTNELVKIFYGSESGPNQVKNRVQIKSGGWGSEGVRPRGVGPKALKLSSLSFSAISNTKSSFQWSIGWVSGLAVHQSKQFYKTWREVGKLMNQTDWDCSYWNRKWTGSALPVSASPFIRGESLDSPETRNVDKMSEKCRKMSENCPKLVRRDRNLNIIFGHFVDIFCLFGWCFGLVTLSNAGSFLPLPLHGIIFRVCASFWRKLASQRRSVKISWALTLRKNQVWAGANSPRVAGHGVERRSSPQLLVVSSLSRVALPKGEWRGKEWREKRRGIEEGGEESLTLSVSFPSSLLQGTPPSLYLLSLSLQFHSPTPSDCLWLSLSLRSPASLTFAIFFLSLSLSSFILHFPLSHTPLSNISPSLSLLPAFSPHNPLSHIPLLHPSSPKSDP